MQSLSIQLLIGTAADLANLKIKMLAATSFSVNRFYEDGSR
ncbi:MAG: hypothetical protein ACLT64_07335 [Streptococcus salivarius]